MKDKTNKQTKGKVEKGKQCSLGSVATELLIQLGHTVIPLRLALPDITWQQVAHLEVAPLTATVICLHEERKGKKSRQGYIVLAG